MFPRGERAVPARGVTGAPLCPDVTPDGLFTHCPACISGVLGSVHPGTEVPSLLLFPEPLAPPRKFSTGSPNSLKNRWDLHCGYIG